MTTRPIDTTGLTKRYPKAVAVENLDLTVTAGEVFGFVGPNGAGKSTTIAMLLGLRDPSAGEVRVLGRRPAEATDFVRRRVGVLTERGQLLGRLSGHRHLTFLLETHDSAATPASLLARVGLDPEDAARATRTYSTGMRQRLRLALALAGEPELLILDEPASGLDPAGIELLRDVVRTERERGATVFFSSHQLGDVAAICDRVGFIVDGRLRRIDDGDLSRDSLAERFGAIVREVR